MNRLQKKCLIGSLVVHSVSLLVLLVGPALMPKKEAPVETFYLVDVKDIPLTDGQTSGGGAPALPMMSNPEPLPPIQQSVVEPPPPQPEPDPAPPVVKQQPKPVKQPDPEPEPVKPVVKDNGPTIPKDPPKNPKSKPDTKPKETAKDTAKDTPKNTDNKAKETASNNNKPKLNNKDQIKVNLTSTRRDGTATQNNNSDAEDKARAQAAAQGAARQAALSGAARSIAGGLSTSTSITIPGDGNGAFLNYGTAVVSIYESRWTIPSNLAGGNNNVRAKVVIRKDGTVISADIVDKSGNTGVNQSVQRVLDSVRFIKAFPPGATDAQRIFYINFDPNKKRHSG